MSPASILFNLTPIEILNRQVAKDAKQSGGPPATTNSNRMPPSGAVGVFATIQNPIPLAAPRWHLGGYPRTRVIAVHRRAEEDAEKSFHILGLRTQETSAPSASRR